MLAQSCSFKGRSVKAISHPEGRSRPAVQPGDLFKVCVAETFRHQTLFQVRFHRLVFSVNLQNLLYGRCHMVLHKGFLCSHVCTQLPLCALLWTWDRVRHPQNSFHQAVQCLNTPKISNYPGVNQHRLLLHGAAFLPPVACGSAAREGCREPHTIPRTLLLHLFTDDQKKYEQRQNCTDPGILRNPEQVRHKNTTPYYTQPYHCHIY